MNTAYEYLRFSITPRCNLHCQYCMPRGRPPFLYQGDSLSDDEILRLIRILAERGVRRVRFTGGEPLLRPGICSLIEKVKEHIPLEEICLTTNGVLLEKYGANLSCAGLSRVNVSLDTLQENKFKSITGQPWLPRVLAGIHLIKRIFSGPVKINVVVMQGINDDELYDFVEFAMREGLIVRFIEFMENTYFWKREYFLPTALIIKKLNERYNLKYVGYGGHGPAEYYSINGIQVGFIKTDCLNCARCSRLRITSNGVFKICLFEDGGLDLKELMLSGLDDAAIGEVIQTKLLTKPAQSFKNRGNEKVYMARIGG